jgi:glycosyltransferase involved in cell wall biosynthesis
MEASVAVYPSHAEAFAMAPLEAMACSCATIYSTRGSGPELIEDGCDGLLVDPGNPDQIADAVIQVLKNPRWARTLGEAGRRRVSETFATSVLIPQYERFYRTCIASYARS